MVYAQNSRPPGSGSRPSTSRERQQQQHLDRLGVSRWQAAAYRGQGIKVAVLDTGFRGYKDLLGKSLPKT